MGEIKQLTSTIYFKYLKEYYQVEVIFSYKLNVTDIYLYKNGIEIHKYEDLFHKIMEILFSNKIIKQ